MNKINKLQKPVVLVLAGHDPSGGAGIQADIESIASAGCHAATVITSLTTQNTCKLTDVSPQSTSLFREQINLILDDMEITACKIGMLGESRLINVANEILTDKKFPIVLDPIISSSTGKVLSDKSICRKILSQLAPMTTIMTPNSGEARKLTGEDNLKFAAEKLFEYGTENVLITGTDEDTDQVYNTLYQKNDSSLEFNWARLQGNFHGSGCTLSSRIAAQLALGKSIKEAVMEAQLYTWRTLNYGLDLGKGQKHPDRFFKLDEID